MQHSIRSAAGGLSATLLLSACIIAFATPANAVTEFNSSASPSSGVKDGTVVTVTASGVPANENFLCVQLVLNPDTEVQFAQTSTIKPVQSNGSGKLTCTQTFHSFSGTDTEGDVRYCPLKKADVNAGFSCGVGLADQATLGQTLGSFAPFSVVGDATAGSSGGGGGSSGGGGGSSGGGGGSSGGGGGNSSGNSAGNNAGNNGGSETVNEPTSVATGSGGLADHVHENLPLVLAMAVLGSMLAGGAVWRLIRH